MEQLDIGSDGGRADVGKIVDATTVDPSEELRDSLRIRHPRVFVSDVGREEFHKPPGSIFAGMHDNGGQGIEARASKLTTINCGDCFVEFLSQVSGVIEGS